MKRFLFIPGLPRCATTSLASMLGQHPQIFLPKIKESHYFLPNKDKYFVFDRKGNRCRSDKYGFISTAHEFEKNYDNFSSDKIYIDGSTLYCVHLEALENIKKTPDIDPYFIILRKDPFKRAVSHYLFSKLRGEEFRPFDEALADEMDGKYPELFLGGYIAGSDSTRCENFIIENWGEDKLLSANIDEEKVFSDDYLKKIFGLLGVEYAQIDTSVKANPLTYITNPFLREFRIFLKGIRALNPRIFDNRVTRTLFNTFMKTVPVKKDAPEDLEQYRDLFMKYFNIYKDNLKKAC